VLDDIKNRSKSRRGAERSAKVKVVASSNVSSSLFFTGSSEWTSRISSSKDDDHSDAAAEIWREVNVNMKFPADAKVEYLTSSAEKVSPARCEFHGMLINDAPNGMHVGLNIKTQAIVDESS